MVEIKITTENVAEMHKELLQLLSGGVAAQPAPPIAVQEAATVTEPVKEEEVVKEEPKAEEEAPKKTTRKTTAKKAETKVEEPAKEEETPTKEEPKSEKPKEEPKAVKSKEEPKAAKSKEEPKAEGVSIIELKKKLNLVTQDPEKATKVRAQFLTYGAKNINQLEHDDIQDLYAYLETV